MLAVLAAVTLAACSPDASAPAPSEPAGDKPVLGLLTSLPIMFSGQFSLDQQGSPLLSALEQDYEVKAVAATDADALAGKDVLFMAHALPQTPDNLVALDAWVRGGGKLLLLADPMLAWETGLPLGHPQAPPIYFGDTGLLGHWGLTLEGPVEGEQRAGVAVNAPGRFVVQEGPCTARDGGFIADCPIGEGQVTLIADADFLEAGTAPGIDLVKRELADLVR